MRKSKLERSIVVVLFIMVLVVFSLAQRDSKKLDSLYTSVAEAGKKFFSAREN